MTCLFFGEAAPLFRLQEVKEVHAVLDLGHDYDPVVLLLEEFGHLDDTADMVAHFVEQNFRWIFFIVDL